MIDFSEQTGVSRITKNSFGPLSPDKSMILISYGCCMYFKDIIYDLKKDEILFSAEYGSSMEPVEVIMWIDSSRILYLKENPNVGRWMLVERNIFNDSEEIFYEFGKGRIEGLRKVDDTITGRFYDYETGKESVFSLDFPSD